MESLLTLVFYVLNMKSPSLSQCPYAPESFSLTLIFYTLHLKLSPPLIWSFYTPHMDPYLDALHITHRNFSLTLMFHAPYIKPNLLLVFSNSLYAMETILYHQ